MFAADLLRRRGRRAGAPLRAADCPLLATEVAFVPHGDDGNWIAMRQGVPSARVSRAVVELLTAMDGRTPLDRLHGRFAASQPLDEFLRLVQRFRATGLLDGSATPPPGRWTYRAPLTVQFATLRAPALFGRLHGLVASLPPRLIVMTAAALVALGGVAAVLQLADIAAAASSPVPLPSLVIVIGTLGLLTLLHETAHGLALTRFGGSPRRAGIMLLYLTPAFFVDVTDGWRLSARRHRVGVALAGPAVHAVVGAGACLAALVLPQRPIRLTLLLLAVACGVIIAVNLIPFVRFDGYLALMSALDEPNLRNRTIRDAAAWTARVLFGGRRASRSLDRWWSVPFGLASVAAPVMLVLFALARAARALAAGGPALGVLVVAGEGAIALVALHLVVRWLYRVHRSGVSTLRFVSVIAVALGTAALAGVVVPVPSSIALGFSVRGDRVVLLQAGSRPAVDLPEGAQVTLLSNGFLVNDEIGRGTLRTRPPTRTTVAPDALFPVTVDGVALSAVAVADVKLTSSPTHLPLTGQARVDLGSRSVWQALWTDAVLAPLSAPGDAHLPDEKRHGENQQDDTEKRDAHG
ncbi:daptide biosynthesis intramembrane metalloprotease [Microbacterium sp. p3-SID336]|uniref:daptide biosynthesis intramembrane metalloprotease n=1 Tax=Microbacterium sp. p3-SID336 TaxID=2916212 RepID=UPI0021A90756|nr:daptide biosynthesis intramembrane metalloprotease [Microbacterium sp. p3-SID336]MCT1477618.1 hypothetical protein [Microbacterium sp. p3-SID336]